MSKSRKRKDHRKKVAKRNELAREARVKKNKIVNHNVDVFHKLFKEFAKERSEKSSEQ